MGPHRILSLENNVWSMRKSTIKIWKWEKHKFLLNITLNSSLKILVFITGIELNFEILGLSFNKYEFFCQ